MGSLTSKNVGAVRKSLAEAARTDQNTVEEVASRFIELRPGLTDKLAARRHHMLTGRRGTGKSTLLKVVRQNLQDKSITAVTVDMERFKGREFPDVLIEILIALVNSLIPKARLTRIFGDARLIWKARSLSRSLLHILGDPQLITHQEAMDSSDENRITGGGAGGVPAESGLFFGSFMRRRKKSRLVSRSSHFDEGKIQRLQQLAPRISDTLTQLVERAEERHAIVFIDDYYFVRSNDQPLVLDYLHQVCKGTGIWLKIGGVGSRLFPYKDGHPPVGMQPTQDLDRLVLDVTLDDFATAKRFLEQMLDGVLAPHEIKVASLFSEVARSRMVLACGGAVARDYITLTDAAIDEAIERLSKKSKYESDDNQDIRIQSSDVHRAVKKRLNTKEEEEFGLDAGVDAPSLSARWRDVCEFARESNRTAFILVRQSDLERTEWGKEIQQLENLRLLHRIKDTIPNTTGWRGKKTVVFMVDLAQVADERLRKAIPEFWRSTAEFDKLRRAEWVYSDDWKREAKRTIDAEESKMRQVDDSEDEPEPLF